MKPRNQIEVASYFKKELENFQGNVLSNKQLQLVFTKMLTTLFVRDRNPIFELNVQAVQEDRLLISVDLKNPELKELILTLMGRACKGCYGVGVSEGEKCPSCNGVGAVSW